MTDGEYEIIYHYDDRGNRIGWESYQNGQYFDRYEAHYDDLDRQIWGGRYDANGNLTSQTEYVYDDEQGVKTYHKNDGGRRVEYFHGDGRPYKIEDYDADGKLTMLQRYYYQDILVPAKEETPLRSCYPYCFASCFWRGAPPPPMTAPRNPPGS